MSVKGVIFDLDGTLVDTIEDIAGAANIMFKNHGLPEYDIPHFLKWIGSGAIKFIERALGAPVERELLIQYVGEFKEIYGQNLHHRSRIFEGIPELLDEMVDAGLKLSVLSNKPHALTLRVVEYYLSAWPFDPVLGQREEVPRKPDPAAALEIASNQGIEPGEMLFVGDSANDILTSRAAGMIPLAVSWGYGRLDTEPVEGDHPTIDHPGELLSFL